MARTLHVLGCRGMSGRGARGAGCVRRAESLLPEGGAVEVGVEVASPSDFDASNAFGLREGVGDLLSDDARGFLEAFGQLKADGRGGFAHFDFGRASDDDIQGDAVGLLDVAREGGAQAVGDGQIHVASTGKEKRVYGLERNWVKRRRAELMVPECEAPLPLGVSGNFVNKRLSGGGLRNLCKQRAYGRCGSGSEDAAGFWTGPRSEKALQQGATKECATILAKPIVTASGTIRQ